MEETKNMAIRKGKYVATKAKSKQTSKVGVPDIGDPDKYELFLRRTDVLEVLLTLDTGNKKMRSAELMNDITRDDLLYTGEYLGGAQHGLNRVFAASEMAVVRLPFYARARGNVLQIGRISQVFDSKNYSMDEGGYERPKDAQRIRVEKWLKELSDIGIVFESGSQWQPLTTDKAHKLVEKIPADKIQETEKLLEDVKVEYLKEVERKAAEIAALDKAVEEAEKASAEPEQVVKTSDEPEQVAVEVDEV